MLSETQFAFGSPVFVSRSKEYRSNRKGFEYGRSSYKQDIVVRGEGGQGAGAQEKGCGRRERKEREAGIFRGLEAGDHVDKRLKKNIINNNFNIIELFELHIASKYTNDANVLAKIRL